MGQRVLLWVKKRNAREQGAPGLGMTLPRVNLACVNRSGANKSISLTIQLQSPIQNFHSHLGTLGVMSVGERGRIGGGSGVFESCLRFLEKVDSADGTPSRSLGGPEVSRLKSPKNRYSRVLAMANQIDVAGMFCSGISYRYRLH